MTPRRIAGPPPITAAAGRATTGPSTTAPTSRATEPNPARAERVLGCRRGRHQGGGTGAGNDHPDNSAPHRARRAVDGDVTEGRERGDSRGLEGRPDAGDEGGPDADDRAGDDRPDTDHQVGIGHVQPGLHGRLEGAGDADAGGEPNRCRNEADGQRLSGNGQHDLASGRADRPHQRRLSGPLGNEDRERVVDAEGGDDHGDAGEGEQYRLEESEEVALDVTLLLGAELGAGDRLEAVRQRGGDSRGQRIGGDPIVTAHEDSGEVRVTRRQQLLGGVGVEGDVGHATDTLRLPVVGQSDDLHRDPRRRQHGGLVADGQVCVLGGSLVDHDLAAGCRDPSLGEPQPSEFGVVDPVGGDGGGSVATNRVAVGADQRGRAADLGDRRRHAVDGRDIRHDRLVEQPAHARLLTADARLVADDDVGSFVGRGERVPESGLGGRPEDQRRGEEGNAENYGDARAGQPPLAAPQRLHGCANHWGRSAFRSKSFIRSRIRAGEGRAIESTMRPSARKMTVSA